MDIHILTITYTLDGQFRLSPEMEAWLKSETPKGIFVTNSKTHLLMEILENNAIKNTFIVGFDLNKQNLKYLKAEKVNFLINQQPEMQGYSAIKGLFEFLTKKDASELDKDIPIEIIVKENIPDL